MRTVCTYFFISVLYSFGGWVLETLLYILRDKTFVNRGFFVWSRVPHLWNGSCSLYRRAV